MKSLKEKIKESVFKSYGSLENPDLRFLDKVLAKNPYRDLIDELKRSYTIIEYTDLNYDRSFNYDLSNGAKGCGLRLSMVGKFAFVWRVHKDDKFVVLDLNSSEASDVISALVKQEFVIMQEKDLVAPFEIKLGDDEAGTVYNVLFNELDDLFMIA